MELCINCSQSKLVQGLYISCGSVEKIEVFYTLIPLDQIQTTMGKGMEVLILIKLQFRGILRDQHLHTHDLTISDPHKCSITLNYPDFFYSNHKSDFYTNNFNQYFVVSITICHSATCLAQWIHGELLFNYMLLKSSSHRCTTTFFQIQLVY